LLLLYTVAGGERRMSDKGDDFSIRSQTDISATYKPRVQNRIQRISLEVVFLFV